MTCRVHAELDSPNVTCQFVQMVGWLSWWSVASKETFEQHSLLSLPMNHSYMLSQYINLTLIVYTWRSWNYNTYHDKIKDYFNETNSVSVEPSFHESKKNQSATQIANGKYLTCITIVAYVILLISLMTWSADYSSRLGCTKHSPRTWIYCKSWWLWVGQRCLQIPSISEKFGGRFLR